MSPSLETAADKLVKWLDDNEYDIVVRTTKDAIKLNIKASKESELLVRLSEYYSKRRPEDYNYCDIDLIITNSVNESYLYHFSEIPHKSLMGTCDEIVTIIDGYSKSQDIYIEEKSFFFGKRRYLVIKTLNKEYQLLKTK